MLFKLTGSPHTQGGKTYVKGDTIDTDVELDKIFARTRKFERISGSLDNDGVDAKAALPTKWGSDVTSIANPELLKGTLRVFQKGPWFSIIDIETGQELNDKKLKRDQLKAFVGQYIEDAEKLINKLHEEAVTTEG